MSDQLTLLDTPYLPSAPARLPLRERPDYRIAADSRSCNLLEILTVLTGKEETAKALLTAYNGSATAIANAPTLELARNVKGISQSLAARIKAAVEFGRRVVSDQPDPSPTISSPADAAQLLFPLLQDREQEYLYVLLLNTRNRLIGQPVEVYHGSLNTSLIRTGEVFRDAIRLNAAGIIVAHNHPSADPSPSPEDVAVTRALIEAGKLLDIDVLDHIVCGHQRFVSLKDRGLGFN